MDKAKGKAKEAAGAISGDEDKKAEGRAQQRKAEAEEQAAQKEQTRRAEGDQLAAPGGGYRGCGPHLQDPGRGSGAPREAGG